MRDYRADGWSSPVTGVGELGKDKRTSYVFSGGIYLDPFLCRDLYNENSLCYRIVNAFPGEALREGFQPVSKLDPNVGEKLEGLQGPAFLRTFLLACELGLATGGCLLVPLLDGDETAISGPPPMGKAIKRWILVEQEYVSQIELDQWGEPSHYVISTLEGLTMRLSAKRVLRFPGVPTPPTTQRDLRGWDLSILQRPYEEVRDVGAAFAGVSVMLSTPAQSVFRMKGLKELMSGGKRDVVLDRLTMAEKSRSAARPIAIDMDDDWTVETLSITGIPDTLDRVASLISMATKIPITKLFGRSPAGLNATGESDITLFYNEVDIFRTGVLDPLLTAAARFYGLSQGYVLPSDLQWKWPALWTPTAIEQAQAYQTTAAADTMYMDQGVLSPQEVRASRFGDENETGITLEEDTDVDALVAEAQAAMAPAVPMGPPA